MSICVISDTHNNADGLNRALAGIDRIDPQFVIHCGDLTDPALLELFAPRPLYFVYGNNDYDAYAIDSACRRLGHRAGPFHRIESGGRTIYACHGHRHFRDQAIVSGQYDVVFSGHSHVRSDERRGHVRVVNPGALYRAKEYSFVHYEPEKDRLEFIVIPKRRNLRSTRTG
jgi:hypothetical protein